MRGLIKWIGCRQCDAPDCDGCNVYRLEQALKKGVFDDCEEHGGIDVEVLKKYIQMGAALKDGHLYVIRDGVLYESALPFPLHAKTVTLPPIEFHEGGVK